VLTRLPLPRAASCKASSRSSSYGISVLTGPKASTSCAALLRSVTSRASSSVGAKKAPATPSPTGCEAVAPPPKTALGVLASAATRSATSACCACEASAPMRTPSTAGSPTTTLASRARERLGHRVQVLARHDGAADRGALLAGLDRHLARHFLDEEVELLVVGRHVGRQDGAVQRVGLGVEGACCGAPGSGARAAWRRCRPSR
jgi:hypothetical protein